MNQYPCRTVRRDAACTAREVAAGNHGYGTATGLFWALALIVGIVPGKAWPYIGITAGAIALLVLLGAALRWAADREWGAKVDTGIY